MTTAAFRMPSLGADMESGTLVEWLVRPGDTVHKGDIVAVVDTSKANVEIECFDDGVIEQLIVTPGTTVPVGTVLATIQAGPAAPEPAAPRPPEPAVLAAGAGEPAPPERPPVPEPAAATSPVTSPLVRRLAAQRKVDLAGLRGTGPGGRVTHADVEAASRPPGRVRSSPLARRLAAELGVDLRSVAGGGPGGAVRARDIRRAAPPPVTRATTPTAAPSAQAIDRSAAMRAQIAVSMARSKREIPHYYLSETIDLDAALRWLHGRNRELPVPARIVPAALLLKASALALRAVPDLNGHFSDGAFRRSDAVHLGVAISLRGGGLVAPAIHDADRLGLDDLMAALKDLVTRTRAGRLRAAELADPTITVSNLGEQGVESILGVIYPPQVALVGFGAVTDRPWSVNGLLGVRPLVTASLAADHRVTDGATGARYLLRVRDLLQRPEEL